MPVTYRIGLLRQAVTLSAPGAAQADGDGGYTQPYTPLDPPTWRCAITRPPHRVPSETTPSGTVIAHATHILTGPYHPGITTQTRLVWTDRSGAVHTAEALDVEDPEGAGIETVVLATEIAP
jgi:hypothetical protein